MGTELEWKYELPRELPMEEILAWEDVRSRMLETPRICHMQTVYYDTPERRLSGRLITLRRRLENERSVVCCKAPIPGAENSRLRGEWELEADDPIAALPRLIALGAPPELAEAEGLAPVCGAEFRRLALLLGFDDGSAAELALDQGKLLGSGRSLPFRELELELKQGAPAAALAFCRRLQERFDLKPQEKSKYARAKEL